MHFGKITGEPARERRKGSTLLADTGRLELLNLAAATALVAAPAAPAFNSAARAASELEQAILLRELARRTGELSWLTRAAGAANRAAQGAGPETRLFAAARLQRALCALLSVDMFADPDGDADAARALAEAEAVLGCAPGRLNGPSLIGVRLGARAAMFRNDREAGLTAAARFEDAAGSLEARVRATGSGEPEWVAAECEHAELLIGLGVQRKEAGLLDRAARLMARLAARLDANRLPLSWMRVEILQGTALRALGEITGEARLLKDAAHAFAAAWDAVPTGHSPMDRARAAHGLALSMQALAEASGETKLYASAITAFDHALSEAPNGAAPFRSMAAYDRAACMARRAERSGDLAALAEAEAAFRADLVQRSAGKDPVAWAVVQIGLARIYEARADLTGAANEIADAAFALSEALDVFAERGLRSLSDVALTALDRLKARR
jgi:tetratricopeptide (TPR) repeat protein